MNLRCIKCGEAACIKLDLCDGDTMTCPECEAEFYVADVREVVDGWSKLLAWLDAHPARNVEVVTAAE